MDLNIRKREILAAIIKTYMETGEPVGSKMLCNILGNRLSPATLRNEMSELCELGFLEQPHTSAGRAPTNEGYRFYITKLMPAAAPDRSTKQRIDSLLEKLPSDTGRLIPAVGEALSDFTGLPAMSATVANRFATIYVSRLIPISRRRFLLVLMTSDGNHGTNACRTIWDLSEDEIKLFERVVNEKVIGYSLAEFTPALLQGLITAAGSSGLVLAPVFTGLFDLAEQLTEPKLSVNGAANLYGFTELHENARQLVELISRRNALVSLLGQSSAPVSVVFGEDSGIEALKSSGLVIAGYKIGGNHIGRIGVIGPTRMNYSYLVPSIEYFAEGISKKLSAACELEE